MKSTEEILTLLNSLLTNELTAINQYFIHAKMCENWGYERLAAKGACGSSCTRDRAETDLVPLRAR